MFNFKGNNNWPVVILFGFKEEDCKEMCKEDCKRDCKFAHAAVMKDYTNQKSVLKLTIRNSLSGQTVFGDEIESGELEIEGEITKKYNQWNLGHENCYYFEFL